MSDERRLYIYKNLLRTLVILIVFAGLISVLLGYNLNPLYYLGMIFDIPIAFFALRIYQWKNNLEACCNNRPSLPVSAKAITI